jgi:hypothetical protein
VVHCRYIVVVDTVDIVVSDTDTAFDMCTVADTCTLSLGVE